MDAGLTVAGRSPFGVALGDLDGGCVLDVVASGPGDVAVLRNAGGPLEPAGSITTGGVSFRVALGDVDAYGLWTWSPQTWRA